MRNWTILALATTMAFGCSDDDGLPIADSGPEVDASGGADAGPLDTGSAEPDAGSPIGACDWSPPYGATVGARMQPVATVAQGNDFELATCDGTGFAFPDQATCDAKLTVLSIAAGWCGPCILESQNLEEQINQMYDPSDVRVLQIIIQDEGFNPPPAGYCQNWVNRFNLTNTQLVDPAQLLQAFFPDNSLPSTIIIDNNGLILSRENGVSDATLSSLRNKLNELLAER